MITGTFTTAVGDISITMDDGGAGAYVEVSKLGNLKYEFDQTPDSVQIDRTIALYSYIQVVFLSLTESSEDLYTRLVDATATTPIDCTLSIDNFGVDTFDFSFELKQENIDYNEKEGTVAVRFTPKIDKEVTISNVINSVTNYKFEVAPVASDDSDVLTGINVNCLPVEDYLDASMQSLFGNNFESFIKLSKNSSNVSYFRGYDNWTSPSTGYVIVDPADLPLPFNNETIQEPEELSITANVTQHTVQSGSLLITDFYVEASNILNEFPVGTAIGWFNDNANEIDGPKRIIRSASSTSNIVVAGSIGNIDPGINIPDTITQVVTDGRIFAYDSNLNQVANDSIKELAGIEGSIYGAGFSKNFYVHRLSDNDTEYITLKYDLVTEIKQKKLNKFLQATVVRQIADYENEGIPNFGQIPKIEGQENPFRMPNLKGAGAFVRGNENATKSLEINLAPVYPFLNKATKTGTRFVNLTDDTAILERAITSAGALSYAQSLNQQSGGLKIEFTYLDALALKPYEVFQFDSTAPEKYQNKQYRITSIAYDFVKNESKIAGYQISDLATPIIRGSGPGEEVPRPPTQPPTSTEVTYNVGWNIISNPTTTNGLGFGTVFGTDLTKGSSFKFNGGYEPTAIMQAPVFGEGYWVNLKEDAFDGSFEKNYQYPGEIFDSNVTINVIEGWNMIPSLGVPTYPVSNTANISNNTTFGFDGSYFDVNVLQPGKGYWIYVKEDGDIKLNNQGTPIGLANLNQDFKQITIATSDTTQNVFFDGTNTNTNVNIQEAFLPPPIGATFDVRINQDETNTALRDLRAVESNTINIDVQQIDSATTLNISPSIFYYISGANDASPSHTANVYTSLSGYSLACSCTQYDTGSLYYTTGPAPLQNFQATFLDGDKIITAQNIVESTPVDVPITTTRITLQPMGANIKLPVRARDIANDDGEILDTVPIAGITGAISDRIQYLNSTGVITRIETTEDAPEFRPVKNLQLSAASYDDYALPTGTLFGVVGISSPYSVTFTGFRDEGGREVTFISRPNVTITFNHEDTNSDAGHRFVLPSSSNVTISEYQTATFVYVTLESRWYLISKT